MSHYPLPTMSSSSGHNGGFAGGELEHGGGADDGGGSADRGAVAGAGGVGGAADPAANETFHYSSSGDDGVDAGDYRSGKRFKKLLRMLTGVRVGRPGRRCGWGGGTEGAPGGPWCTSEV